jgi:hypothetical protein
MVICPVDLEECPRTGNSVPGVDLAEMGDGRGFSTVSSCASGYCMRADERVLIACPDCGDLFAAGASSTFCVACVAGYAVVTRSERE